ncbi:MAG TPA: hypothetical protein VND20_09205 [Candidatus Binataceae bacterium]|nr:hypothetical protein [Candidatus Binataceae bacterium]
MFTMDKKLGYVAIASIQDAIASAFAGQIPLAAIQATASTSLSHELRSGQVIPRNLTLDFSPMLDVLHLARLGQTGLDANTILNSLADPLGELRRIFDGGDPMAVFSRAMDFIGRKPGLTNLAGVLGSFLEGQFGIALSLITTFKNLTDPSFPQVITDACLEYFFSADGYLTVDDIRIAPPMQTSASADRPGAPADGVSRRNAERYVRDIIGVIVEATGNVQYRLRDRYHKMLAQFPAAQQPIAQRWFTGFGAMAEAGLTTAVEETLLGIGQFQVNHVMAAAAGAFAGTAARKATQHVFLSELGV